MPVLIPIKHADGTIEKITLDEFRARQKKTPAKPAPASAKTVEPEAKKPLPAPAAVQAPVSQPAPKPARAITVQPAQPLSAKAKTEEARSLLEEELPVQKQSAPLASADRKEEAEAIVKKLNLPVTGDTRRRLLGLVQLRLKDVRGEAEVRNWLTRPEGQMGIGLAEDKAETVLRAISEELKQPKNDAPVVPLKRPLGTPVIMPVKAAAVTRSVSTSLVKEEGEPLPSASTPINPFAHAEHHVMTPIKKMPKSLNELINMETAAGSDIEALMAPKEQPARAIVRDIMPSRPVNLGPVDELRYITLTDFRRLSANPEEAAARLYQKFLNLKDESYILYMNALAAWRESPLFFNYSDAVVSALNARAKMASDGSDKEKIQMNEVRALVAMQKQLI